MVRLWELMIRLWEFQQLNSGVVISRLGKVISGYLCTFEPNSWAENVCINLMIRHQPDDTSYLRACPSYINGETSWVVEEERET